MKHAVLLDGPIGAGKTTLGRAVAGRIGAAFIDGDDHSDPLRPWYASSLRTSRSILRTALAALDDAPAVVIAWPLRCINWVWFRRRFGEAGVKPLFVSLRAAAASIVSAGRGRSFTPAERERIAVMLAEGYGARTFSDATLDTDRAGFTETLDHLEAELRRLGVTQAAGPSARPARASGVVPG